MNEPIRTIYYQNKAEQASCPPLSTRPTFTLTSVLETGGQVKKERKHEQGVRRLWKVSAGVLLTWTGMKGNQAGGARARWLHNMTHWPDLQNHTYTTSRKVLINWRIRTQHGELHQNMSGGDSKTLILRFKKQEPRKQKKGKERREEEIRGKKY